MIIRKQAIINDAEDAWERCISEARPSLSKKPRRVAYPEAVRNALAAWDEVLGNV